jgi:hypothetical protein
MPRTLDECKATFEGEEFFTLRACGIDFICRYPDPDAYDEAIAGALALEKGFAKQAVESFETLAKASVASHTPQELDDLRRKQRLYSLFRDLGPALIAKLEKENALRGKGSARDTKQP